MSERWSTTPFEESPPVPGNSRAIVRAAGGRHFDGDYAPLAESIISGLKRRGE
jgi:type IV secretory pathway VirJ component